MTKHAKRMMLIAVVALMAPVASLGVASSALAKEPTGDFAVFKQCPRFTAGVVLCLDSQIESGEVTLNKLTVPITNATMLQGGVTLNSQFQSTFVGALNGETLSKTPQPVPGGLSSLINCNEIKGKGFLGRARRGTCRAVFENSWSFAGADETVELAGPASEIGFSLLGVGGNGTVLSLPVRIHLESPLLGRECYIGTSADPIMFNMTLGTTSPPEPNKPISGKYGQESLRDESSFAEVMGHSLVNNTFSAPEATGCGGHFSFFIDPLIDSRIGLPSPAGYNTVIHVGLADSGQVGAVIASEQESQPSEKESPPSEKWHEKRGQGKDPTRWRH